MNFSSIINGTCKILIIATVSVSGANGETGALGQIEMRPPMPISPLWKSEAFQRAFTGSYGIDARIEPSIHSNEKSVLDQVATKMKTGDRKAAITQLTASPLLHDSPALMFSLANLRFEQGEVEDSIKNFKQAITLHPHFRDAHRNLAVAQVQQGQFKEAEPHLIRALELGAQDGLTLGFLAYIHSNQNRHQAALEAYRLAQLTMPKEVQWKLGEAQALLALDQPRAAASIYDELIALQPTHAEFWSGQADAWQRQDQLGHAIANLEFVRRLGELKPADVITLGHLYLHEGILDAALDCYQDAIKSEPMASFKKALSAVEALCETLHWKEAQTLTQDISTTAAYQALLSKDEDEFRRDQAHFGRCQALIELKVGNQEKGLLLVESLVAQDPLDSAALILLAQYRIKGNHNEEAEMLLEQAARDPEHEAQALRIQGQIRVDRGDYKEAIKLFERIQKISPAPNLKSYIESLRHLSAEHPQ